MALAMAMAMACHLYMPHAPPYVKLQHNTTHFNFRRYYSLMDYINIDVLINSNIVICLTILYELCLTIPILC